MKSIKIYKYFILFLFVFNYGCVASFQNYHADKKCTDHETNREYYVGEAFYRPGKCVRIQCLGNLQLWEDECSVPQLNGECTLIPGDLKFAYPKCCPRYECRRVLDHGNFQEVRVYNHYGNLLSNSITQLFVIAQI